MVYEERLRQSQCGNLDEIIQMCTSHVPAEYIQSPWTYEELNHGMGLLQSDVSLDCYMAAYGEMHRIKCQVALQNFPFDKISGAIEIVDWGCGQGIGTMCMLELLKQHNLGNWLKKITLIEPSEKALRRAEKNALCLTGMSVEIYSINKFLPSKDSLHQGQELEDIGYRYSNIVHIFSNILDIKEIDIVKLARMVANSSGHHYILCIGPCNAAAYRIEQFCSIFGNQDYFSKVTELSYAQTKTGHSFTCLTRCFHYNGSRLNYDNIKDIPENDAPVYSDYDLELKIENGLLSVDQARVAYRLEQLVKTLNKGDILFSNVSINQCFTNFVIVRPNVGLLLINVFDKDISQYKFKVEKVLSNIKSFGPLYNEVTRIDTLVDINTNEEIVSPLSLIKQCQISVKDGIEDILMSTILDIRNLSLIKMAVVFPHNTQSQINSFFTVKDKYTPIFGKEFVKDSNVAKNCFENLRFCYHNNSFDNNVFRRIVGLLSPKWHSSKEGRKGIILTTPQKHLVVSSATRQKISGVAGSGKTQVLAQRAINAQKRTGGDVLILTYNITLANYLRCRLNNLCEDFCWSKIHTYHYHHFFRLFANKCNLKVDLSSYEDEEFFKKDCKELIKYSAVFIDEIQDYDITWLKIIDKYFLQKGGELVVFGDPKQNIYHRALDSNGDIRIGVIGGAWNKELKEGKRFTNPLLANLAISFQKEFLKGSKGEETMMTPNLKNQLNFNVLSYVDLRNKNVALDNVAQKCITIIRNSGIPASDFAILSTSASFLRDLDFVLRRLTQVSTTTSFIQDEQYRMLLSLHSVTNVNTSANWKFNRDYEALDRMKKYKFSTESDLLKISTIQSFKGWESPAVILLLEKDVNPSKDYNPLSPEVIYTAITRAREHLSVLNLENNIYHDFFSKI